MDTYANNFNEILNYTGTRFNSKKLEHAYRQHFIKEDKKLPAIVIALSVLCIVFLFFSEPLIPSDIINFKKANLIRAAFIVISIALLMLLKIAKTENAIDTLTFIFTFSLCLTQILVSMDRPPYYRVANTINIMIIIIIFMALPNRPILQLIPGVILSLGGLIICKPGTLLEQNALMLIYLVANTVGVLTSIQLQKIRRTQYFHWKRELSINAQLQTAEKKYSYVVDNVRIGIVVMQKKKVLFSNKWMKDSWGVGEDASQRDVNPFEIIIPEDRADVMKSFQDRLEGKETPSTQQFRVTSPEGEIQWKESTSILIEWDKEPSILSFIYDITERKAFEEELEYFATKDALTGANNRRHFMERALEELAISKRYENAVSFLMLDIDHFKTINDNYGHEAGDKALASFVDCCNSILRSTDIFGRIGGEEFGAVLIQTSQKEAMQIAERIRSAVEKFKIDANHQTLTMTVSIGLTTSENSVTPFEILMKKADEALYDAKRSGRNQTMIK